MISLRPSDRLGKKIQPRKKHGPAFRPGGRLVDNRLAAPEEAEIQGWVGAGTGAVETPSTVDGHPFRREIASGVLLDGQAHI